MADSIRSSKRRRINPPEPPSTSSRKRIKHNTENDVDLYDDIEGAHDTPSVRRSTKSSRTATADRGEQERNEAVTPRKASGRKANSTLKRDANDVNLSNFLVQDSENKSTASAKKRTQRKEATKNDWAAGHEEEEDELGDGGAEQQLLMEAGLTATPTKRKRGRPRKNPLPDGSALNGPTPIQQSSRLGRAAQRPDSHATPAKLRHKLVGQRKPSIEDELEVPETEDELQRANGNVQTAQLREGENAVAPSSLRSESPPLKSPTVQKSRKKAQLSEAELPQFELVKRIVLEKLSNKRPIPLTRLDEEYKKVYQLVEATVTAGESNSMLLIGARGSGKTALVNKIVYELSKDQKDHFHVVRLNGFVHTDDKLALREIWRQLGREIEMDDEEGKGPGKSYADTLAMLLSLLSHPSESRTSTDDDAVAKSVIFVMDEFDLFASHPRQTLLYNLLDIAQSRKAPIAVLGLTTRIDVSEGLEKRVKSRFSHRYVHLSLPRTLSAFGQIVKSAIGLTTEELSFDERTSLLSTPPSAEKSGKKRKGGAPMAAEVNSLITWNTSVEALMLDPAFLRSHIQQIYSTTKSIPSLLSSLLLPISQLNHPSFTAADLITTLNLLPPPSNLHLLSSLSDCALALLIAAARLTILHSTDLVNFGLAYAEYVSLASKARLTSFSSGASAVGATGTRVWSKDVCRGEWERLLGIGLMVPALGMGDGAVGSAASKGMVRVDVALEEIPMAVEGLSAVMERWCKQL